MNNFLDDAMRFLVVKLALHHIDCWGTAARQAGDTGEKQGGAPGAPGADALHLLVVLARLQRRMGGSFFFRGSWNLQYAL